jgi:hypothetical protein
VILLDNLPSEHPLRNTPLLQIKARFKHKPLKQWKYVTPNMNISKNTYNQLSPVWTNNDDWGIEDDLQPDTD